MAEENVAEQPAVFDGVKALEAFLESGKGSST